MRSCSTRTSTTTGLRRCLTSIAVLGGFLALPTTTPASNRMHFQTADSTTAYSDQEQAAEPNHRSKVEVRPHVETTYSSNLYHIPKSRLDQFDTKTAPGERFYNMQGPGDLVTTVGLDGTWRYRLKKKQDLKVRLRTDYTLPMSNGLARYLDLGLRIEGELTRADRLSADFAFIPTRFKKNYSHDVAGAAVFSRADYRQLSSELEFRHRFHKRLSAGIVYEFRVRRFDTPFENRDRTSHDVLGYTELGFGKKVDAGLAVGAGQANSPAGEEFSVTVDRSFRTIQGKVWVDVDLRKHWDLALYGKFRVRNYLTKEIADLAHYNRSDPRVKLGLEATKRMSKSLRLTLGTDWVYSDSNREDPTLNTDEAGYRGVTVGLGLAYGS